MQLKWTDIYPIAELLADNYPDDNPLQIRFTDLHQRILSLEDFSDEPNRSNEKILEAIQAAWIEEID